MLDWLWRLRDKPAEPLRGAPSVRRLKSYSAGSGYVYQYVYEGFRTVARDGGATEFVFWVSADRTTSWPVSVLVIEGAVEGWEAEHGRTLNAAERYAIAKMGLFQAFDERENPEALRAQVRLRPADVIVILERLGIE